MGQTTPASSWVRKIHRVGRSVAVIIPPDAMEHMGCVKGDYLYFDPSVKDFIMLSKAPVPPQFTHPELFEKDAPQPPPDTPPPHTSDEPTSDHQ